MKKILLASLMLSSAFSVMAQTNTEGSLDGTNTSERKTDLQVSMQTQDLRLRYTSINEEYKLNGAGLNVALGYRFLTNSVLDLTSYGTLSFSGYDGDDFRDELDKKEGANYELGSFDLGLAQKLGYNINLGSVTLTPFLQAGLAYGALSVKYDNPTDRYKSETGAPYTKVSLATGLSLAIGNIVPFIKYEYTKMNFSGEWSSKLTDNGVSTERQIRGMDLDSDNQSIAIGASFYL
jgi:hypothetical protein